MTSMNVRGHIHYTKSDNDAFVVVGGTLPMLLSGKGDVSAAIDVAGKILMDTMLDKSGLANTLKYLDARGAGYEIRKADPQGHPELTPKGLGSAKHQFQLAVTH